MCIKHPYIIAINIAIPLFIMADAVAGGPPPQVVSIPDQYGESTESESTAVGSTHGAVTEYRIKGHRYMVKVQPVIGPPYYLRDLEGDGELNVRRSVPQSNNLPQWMLLKW